MRNLLLISMALLCLALSWGCKKKEKDPYEGLPRYHMNPDFKAYFAPAGAGSWYIYYDSITNMYDTVTISKVETYLGVFSDFVPTYISENYSLKYISSSWISWITYVGTSGKDEGKYGYSLSSIGGYGNGPSIDYSDAEGYPDWTDVTIVDSVEINGHVYHDVLQCTQDGLFSPLWIAKGIGPIRRQHWSQYLRDFRLIEYHLEPAKEPNPNLTE